MVVAAIDAGTTGVRCMIVDKNGATLGISRRKWEYITPAYLEIAKEFNADAFWKLICTVTREAIQNAGTEASKIEAVATTSQRHGIVFLDADGKELYAAPNIDARGAMSQYVIDDAIGEKFFEITGCWPPMMYGPSRLAWFEEEEPEIYNAVAHVLPINDWISFRLSGVYSTDPSAASATGFLDVKKRSWSEEIMTSLNLDLGILPKIHNAGEMIGEVTNDAEKDCGLLEGLPVIQGGADSQSAVLASDGKSGDAVIIGGCTPGDCHYVSGNFKTRRRITALKTILGTLGLDEDRVWLRWISAAEGAKFAKTMKEITEVMKAKGPSSYRSMWSA